jgi:PKD repeat protein
MKLRTAVAGIATTALAAVGLIGASLPAHASQPSDPAPSATAMVSDVPGTNTPAVDDGDVRAIAKVGTTMVIGGNFTSVNGLGRGRIAAFNATSGALTSFNLSVNGEVSAVVPGPNDHSVYIGGQFTQVGATAARGLALVDLSTSSVVTSWKPPSLNFADVTDLVQRGNRVYATGTFTKVGNIDHAGIVALNATTGALDPFMNVQFTGHHNDSGSGAQGAVGPWDLDVTNDGKQMVVIGNFKYADGLLRDQVAQIDLTGTQAVVRADWATNRYSPYCYNWAFDSYVRGVSYSPDGSYFVVAATGGGVGGTLCDAASRFETAAVGTAIDPTWVTETGGDTVWGVTVTNNSIFVGGHQRWANNPYGVDAAKPGAVPRPGLMALDPISGRPLKWNPGRNPPGKAVYAALATSDGLYIGSNTDWIGNRKYKRMKIAFFPYQGGGDLASTTTGSLPGTVFLGGAQTTGATNVLYRVNAGGSAIQSLDSGPDWLADTDSTSPYRNSGSNAAGWDPIGSVDSTVPPTAPSSIYSTERWDPNDATEMQWSFPVTAGTPVQVRVYLGNQCSCTASAGQRVFNVTVNGQAFLTNFDIVAAVGNEVGTMRSVNVTAPASGQVTIGFGHNIENPLVNGIEIVRTDIAPPPPASADSLAKVALTTSSAGTPQDVTGSGIAWGSTRGAFMVGKTVFYGSTDGYLYRSTFDGSTFGTPQKIDPYHDPAWKDVDNNLGGTFDGALPTLYSQMPNVTGMFYNQGKLYYTLYGDSTMHWRWFSPDSGIVDERTQNVSSSVAFNDADGMFANGSDLFYVTKSDGKLWKIAFSGGVVSGARTQVSGPGIDSVNWRNRSMFLYGGPALNQSPTASFTSTCTYLACDLDGSASVDPDGSITGYAWDFGDGGTATGAAPSHAFAAAGTYHVKLTVTDNKGATGTLTKDVTVTAPPPNTNPTASFTSSCTDGQCSFDGSGSFDPDGSIASYAWDFGDGQTGTGVTPSHTFLATGAYDVQLTVTDNRSGTGSVTHSVSVTVPASSAAFVGAAHSTPGSAKFKAAAMPATAQAGDTLLLMLTTPSTVTWTGPTGITGWTQVDSFTNSTIRSTLWTKTATAADVGKTVRVDDPSGYRLGVLTLAVYRGMQASTTLVTSHAGDSNTSSHVSPTVSAAAGDWVVSYWSDKSANTTAWTAPAGVVERDEVAADPGAYRFSELVADSGGPVPAGTYGGLTATTNATSDKAAMWTIVLTPSS